MDLTKPSTQANLEAAFGGESMANRKYLFFADVAKQLVDAAEKKNTSDEEVKKANNSRYGR